MIKIDQKIVGFHIVEESKTATESSAGQRSPHQMHEAIQRPETLVGSTYKVKTPLSEHAMYITINDIILNEGTAHEERRPFEIFINSKSMEHFQWIVALTRIISAVFRKGGDITFLAAELRSVFDPKGGYFKNGGKYMPSLVAEIGDVIEQHLKTIGIIQHSTQPSQNSSFPASAILCQKCLTNAVVIADGCATCLNCGDSKCG